MPRKCLLCNTRPLYNYEGESNGIYCAIHKKDEMIDVKNKQCLLCNTRPLYNYEGELNGIYCAIHKKDGMIDVKSKRCLLCNTRPLYNYEGESNGIYCAIHKKDGMIDVKSKRCLLCNTRPLYNYEGESNGIYCAIHKKDEMIDVKNKQCLLCNTRPLYNYEGELNGIYCAIHKKDGMVNVKNKRCKSDWCFTQVTNKYDGYCLFCYMNLFPDKPVSRNYKTKEYSVVDFVKTTFSSYNWVADKIINGGCSKKRPDLLLDLLYQIIIIEVDENQHIAYDCSCENKRIMELSQDVGFKPIIFIRFNPDNYYINDNKLITSCWGQDKNGICVIKKNKKIEWEERLKTLENQINYWISPENKTNKTVEIIQLYYDF